jgi:DNA processing protein
MNKVLNILFLTYLTGYSIRDILCGIRADDLSVFMDDYLKQQSDKGNSIKQDQINRIWTITKERHEEMRFKGIGFIPIDTNEYPESIAVIQNPPPMLYTKGKIRRGQNLAIVGTRETSEFARGAIRKVIKIFGENRYGIVSGLAYGIDKMAHEAALEFGIYTLAVLPNSLDHIYPKEHLHLANEIIENEGGLVSELPVGINLGKKGFVQRNRLQSAFSEIIMPIEMGINSGTMYTVQFSIQQKKLLLVIQPDSVQEKLPQYEGIVHLTKSSYEKIKVLKDISSISEIFIDSLNSETIVTSEGLSDVEIKQKRDEILKLFKDKIKSKCQKATQDLIDTYGRVEKYTPIQKEDCLIKEKKLKSEMQQLVFDFLMKHTIIRRKDLEKIVKSALKKIESQFIGKT